MFLLISGQLVSACTALLHSIVNRQEMLDTVSYTYKWSHIYFFTTSAESALACWVLLASFEDWWVLQDFSEV